MRGGGGGGHFEPEPKPQARSVPRIFFWSHRQCAFMIVLFDLTFASLVLGVVSKTGNLFDFLKLNLAS